jgi:intracellular sulfur oxidation DsrE/DsrF family protein
VQPDKTTQYKVIFDVTSAGEAKGVNSPLFHIARAVNIMASAGVPLKNLHYVAIIHGKATHIVMDNASYKKRYGKDNPNLDLIAKLAAAGVKLEVCGQALHGEKIKHEWVDKHVTITLSALSSNIIWETKGYAYISM